MANIARFEPFTDSFEDLFRTVLRPIRWEGEDQALRIKVDVDEDDKSYKVKAEIPGVRRKTSTFRSIGIRCRSAPNPSARKK